VTKNELLNNLRQEILKILSSSGEIQHLIKQLASNSAKFSVEDEINMVACVNTLSTLLLSIEYSEASSTFLIDSVGRKLKAMINNNVPISPKITVGCIHIRTKELLEEADKLPETVWMHRGVLLLKSAPSTRCFGCGEFHEDEDDEHENHRVEVEDLSDLNIDLESPIIKRMMGLDSKDMN
jgi:hypothetical protein